MRNDQITWNGKNDTSTTTSLVWPKERENPTGEEIEFLQDPKDKTTFVVSSPIFRRRRRG